ncbi:hypothetical protein AB1N83_009286 [Pleurotus pulmonarius]
MPSGQLLEVNIILSKQYVLFVILNSLFVAGAPVDQGSSWGPTLIVTTAILQYLFIAAVRTEALLRRFYSYTHHVQKPFPFPNFNVASQFAFWLAIGTLAGRRFSINGHPSPNLRDVEFPKGFASL